MPQITPNFLFESSAEEAALFYTRIFPNSRVNRVSRSDDGGPLSPGSVMAADFVLDGQDFTAINAGRKFAFSESVSFRVVCHGQKEVDHYWAALSEGGSEGRCGWLTDRFGVSWQVTPVEMGSFLGHPDPDKARRATSAMMQMSKMDLSALQAAIDDE